MKWFKHETNASRSESLALLRAASGFEGYGFYWAVLEILAENCEEIDESGESFVSLPTKIWCGTLSLTPQKFKKLLETCTSFGLLSVSLSEVGGKKVIRIGSKDVTSRADEYTARKASRQRHLQRRGQEVSGQCRDNVGADKNRLDKNRSEKSREEDIKDLHISYEICEDFPSSSGHDSERDILSEATDSHLNTHSHTHIHSETVSSSKRKIAVDGNDRNRKSSDNAERDANAKDKNLEDCEKDHESVCALESQKLQEQQTSQRLWTSQTTYPCSARSCGGDASVGVSGDVSGSKRKTSFDESDINDAGGESDCRAGEDVKDRSEDLARHGSDRKPVCITGPRLKTSSGFKKQAGSGCSGANCDIRAGCDGCKGGCEADSARSDADRKTNHAPDLADARSCDVKLQSSQTAESSFKRKTSRDGYGEPSGEPSAHGQICEYREASREPDLAVETSFCDSACGLGDCGESNFCASAHAHACDGRRASRAQEDASVPASEDVSGGVSGNAPADVPGLDDDVGAGKRTAPNACPHKEIVALYHEVLPELRCVRAWNATREKHLRARWREDKSRQSLSWWREYFTRVKASSFLAGKKTDWSADFDWLIRPTNMAKVLEGKYDDAPVTHERARGTNIETLFRELVSAWPADRVGDVQAAKKTFCKSLDVGVEEGNRRLKNIESWALVVLEREPKYVPRLDKWLAGLDVSIPPPESRPTQYEWVPVEDAELEAVAS